MNEISFQVQNLIVSKFFLGIAECIIPALDMAASKNDLGELFTHQISPVLTDYGLSIAQLYIANISSPPSLEVLSYKRTDIRLRPISLARKVTTFFVNGKTVRVQGECSESQWKSSFAIGLGLIVNDVLSYHGSHIQKDGPMRALLQRVSEASVEVDKEIIGEIGSGFLILFCAMAGDEESGADQLVNKICKLRVFADESGKMNRSLSDIEGSVLVVSQFTLAANMSRGNRPGFSNAAKPEDAKRLFEYFTVQLRSAGIPLVTGSFGADMKVRLINDGPATFFLDTIPP